MTLSIIAIILVIVIAFLAGMEGILDQFQFHQPLIACSLIGLVTGNLDAGIVLGGALQMIALGWANIGAAVAPDAALAAVASSIILVLGGCRRNDSNCCCNSSCCCWPIFNYDCANDCSTFSTLNGCRSRRR